ncbi:MAG: HAD family hydrolase [Pseudomonadota bacterium]
MSAQPIDTTRILLVLDVDETLIHAREKPLERRADFRVSDYHVYCRPHLPEFLARCSNAFEVAVWSTGSDDYVNAIIHKIFPDPNILQFIWGRSRATLKSTIADEAGYMRRAFGHMDYIKPLEKVVRKGWSIEKILIVDDSPEKCVRNYGNAIYPRAFEGELTDDELPKLAAYLESLKDCENVRKLEKRNWRDKV